MKHLISVPSNTISHFHQISGLPADQWFVTSDPEEKRVGSGGGTAHLLTELFHQEEETQFDEWLQKEKRVIIHAGGQSRRLPAYATAGKSLLPMPVFRWSRGQQLNQRLIHLQTPLFDQILDRAPDRLNTLVASGDTLIFSGKTIPEIPDADVVCFGLWLEPEKATNHGVFFAKHDSPGNLQFMLQNPSIPDIKELIHKYYFLMDIGIWLLSDKAVKLLMKRSGWNGSTYENQLPDFYDLYSDFGIGMGDSPINADSEISQLKVALVNLEGGEFYHLGNTSELITSNLSIQNRITDQREIWHRQIKPHPSIFVLNSEVRTQLTSQHTNLWIENAFIPSGWNLQGNHALTNIPENNWNLKLHNGDCLDLVPISPQEVVVRNYGFTNPFRGTRNSESTLFMELSLPGWLEKRGLSKAFSSLPEATDIQFLPLFPLLKKETLSEAFLQWLIDPMPANKPEFTELWLSSRRVSAEEISLRCNIPSLEEQRSHLRVKAIPAIANNYNLSLI